MPHPTNIIQGPAFVEYDGYTYYTEGNVTVEYDTRTFAPQSAIYGALGTRFTSRIVRVSFKPVGVFNVDDFAKYWPYTPEDVGKSLCNASSLKSLVVASVHTGQNKVTFPNAAITGLPPLRLSTNATVWDGAITFTCLGNPNVEPTNAAYWQTIASTSSPTNGFDGANIITPRVTVDYDTVTNIEPDTNGVSVDLELDIAEMATANYGTVQLVVNRVGPLRCRFSPVNKAESDYATILALQGASAIRPGDVIGSKDIVLKRDGDIFLTLKNMGPSAGGLEFGVAAYRLRELTFESALKFSQPGPPDALWAWPES